MTLLNLQIAASNRDGDELTTTPAVNITFSYVRCYNGNWWFLLGFTGVAVPQAAIISSAILSIKFTSTTYDDLIATLFGEDADNSAVINDADTDNISTRTLTTATSAVNFSSAGVDWVTIDVTSIVQEIVDRGSFTSDALSLIGHATATSTARITSYDGSSSNCAKLDITYTFPQTVSPTAIESTETFGSPTVIIEGQTISPATIASAEAFGSPTIVPGEVTISPTAIASAEAFGSPTVSISSQIIQPTSITSAEAFGSPTLIPGSVTIHPTGIPTAEAFGLPRMLGLLTLQKTVGSYPIALSLTIGDTGRPHFTRWIASGAGNNPSQQDMIQMPNASYLRVQAYGGNIYKQILASLTSSSNWIAAWTSITAGYNPALLLSSSRLLLVYYSLTGSAPYDLNLCHRYSDNNGTSWSAEAIIVTWAAAGALTMDISAAASAIFYVKSDSGIVHFRSYSGSAWSSDSPSSNLAATNLAAIKHAVTADLYYFLYAYQSGTDRSLKVCSFNSATFTYGTPLEITNTGDIYYSFIPKKIIYQSNTALYLAFSQVNEENWDIAGSVDDDTHRILISYDPQYWSDALVIDAPASRHIETGIASGSSIYAPAYDGAVYHSLQATAVTDAQLIQYQFSQPDGECSAVAFIPDPTNLLALLTEAGATVPLLKATISRGIDQLKEPLPPLFIYSWLWQIQGKYFSFRASSDLFLQTTIENNVILVIQTVQSIVKFVVAIAGLKPTFDSSSFWSSTATVSLTQGTNIAAILNNLAIQFAFTWRITTEGYIYCYRPSSSDASNFTYGSSSGEHPLIASSLGRALPAATHYRYPDPTDGAQTGHQTAWPAQQQAAAFRALTYRQLRAVGLAANRDDIAEHYDTEEKENTYQAWIKTSPNFYLQVGNILTLHNVAPANLNNKTWRVIKISETCKQGENVFIQEVDLRGH